METIIFLGTYRAGSSREALKTAKNLGYYTILFTNRSRYLHQSFPEINEISITSLDNIEKLREQIQKIKIQGKELKAIISFVDPYVSTAAQLSQEFCGTQVSVAALRIMENKIETRIALEGIPCNINYLTTSTNSLNLNWLKQNTLNFPLIIKLPVSCGSRDVILIEKQEILKDYINKVKTEYPDETLLIEEYVEGQQYLIEVVVSAGKIQPVVIIKQDISFAQRFIVTGYSIVPNLAKAFYQKLVNSVEIILNTIGLRDGTCHLELRLNDDGQWKLIEINPRMSGGAMNQMIKAAYGIDLVEETIKHYLGHSLSLDRKKAENLYTYYLTSKIKGIVKRISGIEKALQVSGVKDVRLNVSKGNRVYPPLSMGHRIAYIIATGDSIKIAENSAKKAAKKIKFYLQSLKHRKKITILNKE